MENDIYQYNCEQCDFHCDEKFRWDKHIETEKHKTGKRKSRKINIEPFKCDKCEFITNNNIKFKEHKLNNHSNKEEREKEFKYYCKICDKGYFYQDMYNRHINTEKHKLCMSLINK